MSRFMRAAMGGAALAIMTAGAAVAGKVPNGFLEEKQGLLRHQATGAALPRWIGPYQRALLSEGKTTTVAIYIPRQMGSVEKHDVAIAIDSDDPVPTEKQRAGIRAEVEKIATPEMLSEGPFIWPGHPSAQTFHGAYVVGLFRKEYWSASDGKSRVLAVITLGRRDSEQMALLSAAVARDVFGGATLAAPDGQAAASSAPSSSR